MQLDNQYWSNRYQQHTTGWDAGTITTPLKEYIDQLTNKNLSILIPGCGNAHEASYLLEQGFTNVTLIDISSVLCEMLRVRLMDYGKAVKVICGDFFALSGQFDLVIEQTFFCALDPALREAYATRMAEIIKPGGCLAGVLFNRDFDGGPPFGGNESEYTKLFDPYFKFKLRSPCYNSIPPRQGAELFIKLVK